MTLSLDRERIYIHCPRCSFYARPFLRQIRLRETIVCGGCKGNIRLDDHLGSFRKAQRRLGIAFSQLADALGSMTINIRL